MAPQLKFLLIKAQIDLKINFLPIKSLINSFKNSIKSINIQIWAFLLKFQIFLVNRAFLLQEYIIKNSIFVFLKWGIFFKKIRDKYLCLFSKPHCDTSMSLSLIFFFLFASYDSLYSIFDLEMVGIKSRDLSKIMWNSTI